MTIYSDALSGLFGKPGEWTYSNRHNEPDPEFDERVAKRRVKELKRLIRIADEAGYRFDTEYDHAPEWEISKLEEKLFVGPRKQIPTQPPSEMMNRMIDQVFAPNPFFKFLMSKDA